MFGNMPEIRFEYFDMVVFDNAGGGGVVDGEHCWLCGAHCMVWLTSMDCNCGEG
jgi:hypothetical protein